MRLVILAAALGASLAAARAEEVPVVATFSILGDMVREVGGDRVAITTLVGPDGDGHVYQPTPADARALRNARLVVANGLGFEGWIDRLVEASGYDGPVLLATEGIDPIAFGEAAEDEHEHAHDDHGHADEAHGHDHDHEHEDGDEHHHHAGEDDPHAWQSLDNARIYVTNIAEALTEVDPEGAATYAANRDRYLAEIAALDAELDARLARIPVDRRTVVTSHDAFGYLAEETGIRFLAPVGVSTDADVSAQDVAALITQIRAEGISAIFLENVSDPRMIEQIASETGVTVGGVLYSDALSEPIDQAGTYLEMMRHNIETLTGALGA
jgi:zinc/manganese transport system substrate-binding protein